MNEKLISNQNSQEQGKSIENNKFGISLDGSINKHIFHPEYYYTTSDGGLKVVVSNKEDIKKSLDRLIEVNTILKNSEISIVIKLLEERYSLLIDLPKIRELSLEDRNKKIDVLISTQKQDMEKAELKDFLSVGFQPVLEILQSMSQSIKELRFETTLEHQLKLYINEVAIKIAQIYSTVDNIKERQSKQLSS